jgi:PPM family protein phosphatase
VSGVAGRPRLAKESIAGRRPYQEDSVFVDQLPDGRTLVAIADGMGGHAAGEVASALALERLVDALGSGRTLDEAFRTANQSVFRKSKEPGKLGMGTTLVAALLEGDAFQVANVGDSRCYLISGDGIRRLSQDHSFVAEAMKRGQSEEEAMSSQWKDALTRSIGTDEDVEVDVFGPFPVEPSTALVLCSDGLYKTLADERLKELFTGSSGPMGAARALVSSAFEAGSDDNISVAIAEFGEVPRSRSAGTMPIEFHPRDDPAPPAAPDSAAEPPDAAADDARDVRRGWLGKLWPKR